MVCVELIADNGQMHNQIAEDSGICMVHREEACVLPLKFLALQQTEGPLNHRERKERPAVILYKVNQSTYICLFALRTVVPVLVRRFDP